MPLPPPRPATPPTPAPRKPRTPPTRKPPARPLCITCGRRTVDAAVKAGALRVEVIPSRNNDRCQECLTTRYVALIRIIWPDKSPEVHLETIGTLIDCPF